VPPDAVDTEREIKDRTEQREKPDKTKPECGSAGIAFMKQCMNGSKQRGKDGEARNQVRPEP
jgi:hypothetical protein